MCLQVFTFHSFTLSSLSTTCFAAFLCCLVDRSYRTWIKRHTTTRSSPKLVFHEISFFFFLFFFARYFVCLFTDNISPTPTGHHYTLSRKTSDLWRCVYPTNDNRLDNASYTTSVTSSVLDYQYVKVPGFSCSNGC